MPTNKPELTGDKLENKPGTFVKGIDPRRNLAGRPEGSISPITAVKKIFADNPDTFKEFLEEYMKNPNNAKHIVEMIDGKPRGDAPINVEKAVFMVTWGDDDNS